MKFFEIYTIIILMFHFLIIAFTVPGEFYGTIIFTKCFFFLVQLAIKELKYRERGVIEVIH